MQRMAASWFLWCIGFISWWRDLSDPLTGFCKVWKGGAKARLAQVNSRRMRTYILAEVNRRLTFMANLAKHTELC